MYYVETGKQCRPLFASWDLFNTSSANPFYSIFNFPIISPLNQCVVSPFIDNLIPHRSHVLILNWKPSQFETSSRDMDTLRNTVAYYKKLRNNEIDHGDILAFRLAAIMRYTRSWWWC